MVSRIETDVFDAVFGGCIISKWVPGILTMSVAAVV